MKLGVFCMVMAGIIILLNAGGVVTNSGALIGNASVVYNFVNTTEINRDANQTNMGSGLEEVQTSGMWVELLAILGLSIGVGLVAGLITGVPPTSVIKGGLVSFFGGAFLADMLSVYNLLYDSGVIWIRWVAVAIFVPLTIYFFSLLISWWEGSDN